MRMQRSELVEIVRKTAERTGLLATDRDSLVEAVSDPSVTKVARTDWVTYDETHNECRCPATLAGMATAIGPKDSAAPTYYDRIVRFANAFDKATAVEAHRQFRVEDRRTTVIEILD